MSATEENRSITATEASVAGSSVAITEAEEDREDASFSTGGGNNSDHKIAITKSSELDISIALDDKGDDDSEGDEEYSAPGHFHALRTPAKLKGARSRSSSRSRPNSRRNSPSPERNKTAQAIVEGILGSTVSPSALSPSASVGSSLDGIGDHNTDVIDPDLLLDKLGFKDLDPNNTQEEKQEMLRKHISSNSGLPTLNERMSETTMDDTQAFHDLSYHKKTSTGGSSSIDEEDGKVSPEKAARVEAAVRLEMLKNSGLSNSQIITTMAPILNTLDEGEEDLDDDEEEEDVVADNDNVLDIPEDMIHLKKEKYKNRDTMNSMSTMGRISSLIDDKDDDNADVEVPTSVFNELNVNEGKREMLHRDTSMAVVTGSEPDYLEADEQDGLEADLEV